MKYETILYLSDSSLCGCFLFVFSLMSEQHTTTKGGSLYACFRVETKEELDEVLSIQRHGLFLHNALLLEFYFSAYERTHNSC